MKMLLTNLKHVILSLALAALPGSTLFGQSPMTDPAARGKKADGAGNDRPPSDAEATAKHATRVLEHMLARLRTATTDEEKRRLERAIVEFVRAELRGTWLSVAFTVEDVESEQHTVRVEFDGSRLKQDAVAKLLRNAGVDVREVVALA